MPIAPHLRKWYGHKWRTVTRPRILARDCYECVRCGVGDRAMCLVSALHIAHLDGDPTHDEDTNYATLCPKCHRAHDYGPWAIQYRAYLERKREEQRVLLEPLIRAAKATLAGRLHFGDLEQIAAVRFLGGVEFYQTLTGDPDRQYDLLEAW